MSRRIERDLYDGLVTEQHAGKHYDYEPARNATGAD